MSRKRYVLYKDIRDLDPDENPKPEWVLWREGYPMPRPDSVIINDGDSIYSLHEKGSLEVLTRSEFSDGYHWVPWEEHPENESLYPNLNVKDRSYLENLDPSDDDIWRAA